MRYSVLFFVLVNGIIRDSAITSTKAATIPEPLTTTSSTTGITAAPEATSTSEPTTTTTTVPSTTTVAKPDSTTISELTSIPTSSSTTTQASGTASAETSLQTTKKPTTALKVTTTESTATTSGTMAAAKTTTATTTTEDTTIISETISKITKNSTLTTVGPTSTDNSSTKPISTTNQTTPKVTETTTLQPNTTTSNSRNTTETTTNTDQPGSLSTTVSVFNETTTTEISTTDSRETTVSSSDSSTSKATSTKQPDATTKYPGETKDLSSLRINIDLQISLSNATYNESLKDKSSEIYISYKRSFRTKLYETYEDISGFNHVIINNFSNGSVVCEYTIVVNADSNITDIGDKIADATLKLTNSRLNISGDDFEIYVNETIVNATIQNVIKKYEDKGICNLIDRACETFEDCSPGPPGKIRCTHKCYSGKNVCHNGGSCFYDARKKSMECKCTKNNDFIYYGPSCIQKAEKFALHKNDIIGLAAGCGGGVVVILLVVIIVLLMKKTRKGKESDQKLDLSREVSIEDIRLHRLSESHSSNGFQNRFEPRAKPNPYETRMPETKFLHGRAHDIYKDSTGEETYIYPSPSYIHPISASGHRDSTKSGQSMYDYIDTESRFEIQRPRIRLGQSSAF